MRSIYCDRRRGFKIRRMLIVHNDLGHSSVSIHSKLYLICYLIALRCNNLFKCVLLACNQLAFDEVSFVCRYPFLNNISVLVNDLERCAGQFLTCGDILLGNLHLCCVIYHNDKRIAVLRSHCGFNVFYRNIAVNINSKFNVSCNHITVGCGNFFKHIFTRTKL